MFFEKVYDLWIISAFLWRSLNFLYNSTLVYNQRIILPGNFYTLQLGVVNYPSGNITTRVFENSKQFSLHSNYTFDNESNIWVTLANTKLNYVYYSIKCGNFNDLIFYNCYRLSVNNLNRTYYIIHNPHKGLSWSESNLLCKNINASLITIFSKEDIENLIMSLKGSIGILPIEAFHIALRYNQVSEIDHINPQIWNSIIFGLLFTFNIGQGTLGKWKPYFLQ